MQWFTAVEGKKHLDEVAKVLVLASPKWASLDKSLSADGVGWSGSMYKYCALTTCQALCYAILILYLAYSSQDECRKTVVSFLKWGTWDLERWGDLSEVTQLWSSRTLLCAQVWQPGTWLLHYTNILVVTRKEKGCQEVHCNLQIPQNVRHYHWVASIVVTEGLVLQEVLRMRVHCASWLGALYKIKSFVLGCRQKEESRIYGEERHPHLSLKALLSQQPSFTPAPSRISHPGAHKATSVACFSVSSKSSSFLPQGLCICSSFCLGNSTYSCSFPVLGSQTKSQLHRETQITQLFCLWFCLSTC